MKIYISSSWKNRERVRNYAMLLRKREHEVYDFTDKNCRETQEIPPEKFPEQKFVLIDASGPIDDVFKETLKHVDPLMGEK